MKKILIIIGLIIVIGLAVVYYNSDKSENSNEAAAKCQEDGHSWELRTTDDDREYGVCIFSDSSECLEWVYYRGECQMGDFEKVSEPVVLGESIEVDRKGKRIKLKGDGSPGQAILSWEVLDEEVYTGEGFRVIYSKNTMPLFPEEYPGDEHYKYVRSMPEDGYVWKNIPAGSYYFRVCTYSRGQCQLYSNDAIVTITKRDI